MTNKEKRVRAESSAGTVKNQTQKESDFQLLSRETAEFLDVIIESEGPGARRDRLIQLKRHLVATVKASLAATGPGAVKRVNIPLLDLEGAVYGAIGVLDLLQARLVSLLDDEVGSRRAATACGIQDIAHTATCRLLDSFHEVFDFEKRVEREAEPT